MQEGCKKNEEGGGGEELQTQGEGAVGGGVAGKMIGSGREIGKVPCMAILYREYTGSLTLYSQYLGSLTFQNLD
jgi:outer membrane lipoprotein SlyB